MIMLPRGVCPFECHTPHSASLLPPALLAPAYDTCLARDTCSLPLLTPHVTHLICADSRLTRRTACPLRPSLAAPHPARTLPLLSPSLALYLTSNDSRAPPLASSPTPNAVGMPCRSRPRRWPLGTRAGAPQVILAEPWHPQARPDGGGARASPLAAGSHPDGRNRSAQASLALYCKHMFQVFQKFQRHVAFVSYKCCKSRSGMLHMLHMLQVFQRHVVSVSSKCLICSRRMLQAFSSG
jgi:hypothetical protein